MRVQFFGNIREVFREGFGLYYYWYPTRASFLYWHSLLFIEPSDLLHFRTLELTIINNYQLHYNLSPIPPYILLISHILFFFALLLAVDKLSFAFWIIKRERERDSESTCYGQGQKWRIYTYLSIGYRDVDICEGRRHNFCVRNFLIQWMHINKKYPSHLVGSLLMQISLKLSCKWEF